MINLIEEARRKNAALQQSKQDSLTQNQAKADSDLEQKLEHERLAKIKNNEYHEKAPEALVQSGVQITLEVEAKERNGSIYIGEHEGPHSEQVGLTWYSHRVGTLSGTKHENRVIVEYTRDDTLEIMSGIGDVIVSKPSHDSPTGIKVVRLTREQWKQESILSQKLEDALNNPWVTIKPFDHEVHIAPGLNF